MIENTCRRGLLGGLTLFAVAAAYGDSLGDYFQVSGNLRLYSYSRDYKNTQTTDLHSTSFGGKLKIATARQEGFGAGAALYFAQDLGLNNHDQNNKYINPLLMGTDYGIYVPGEAYVQYKTPNALARVGNQSIDNPWINPSDGFMIPNLYRGALASYSPLDGMQIEAERVTEFKNRTSVGFDRNTLFALPYDNPHFTGTTNGAAAVGATYKSEGPSAKAWLYRFYDFANMAYVQGGYKLAGAGVSPFADVQYMRETGSGAMLLGTVDSKAYGAKVGLALPDKMGTIYAAYNKVPTQMAAGISNGNLLSPYTQVYNTDPLYTTVMNYGLVSARAAGHAWQLGTALKLMDEKLDTVVSVSRYMTEPYVMDVNAIMLDLAYHLGGSLKGATARYRLGYEHGLKAWGSGYFDSRIMLQYAF